MRPADVVVHRRLDGIPRPAETTMSLTDTLDADRTAPAEASCCRSDVGRAKPDAGSAADLPRAIRRRCPAILELRHAGPREVEIAYECVGPEHAPVVIVAGGISANRHLAANAADATAGWWSAHVGPGLALDPARVRLLSIDWLGADGTIDAPLDTADQADALAAVLDHLGVARAQAFVGASYGAMVGLQFSARHGDRLGALLAISGAHKPHPFACAARALQRRIVRAGAEPRAALSLARQLALLTYRTPEEFAERFAAPPVLRDGRAEVGADAYLQACGARDAARLSPVAFLRLTESIDLHAVDPAQVRTPTTLVAIGDDRLVPSADLHALAAHLGGTARLHHLRSRYGHDAFLVEHAAIATIVREFLAGAAP
jgi:homoserine O-acetyltransferase